VLILVKIFGGTRDLKNYTPAVRFCCLSFNQVADTIAYGQFNIIILLGLSLTMLWVQQRRPTLAGLALALPIGIKLFPILWMAFWVFTKRWRSLVGLLIGGLVLALLSTLVVGWDNIWLYLTKIIFGVNHPEITISNQAWFGFLGRLSVPKVVDDYKEALADWVTWLGYGGALLFSGITLYVVGRSQIKTSQGLSERIDPDLLRLSALNLLMLIIPPFVWFHYATLGLVSILALLPVLEGAIINSSDSNSKPTIPLWQLLLFGLAFATLAYGGRSDFFFTEAVGLARFGSSYRFGAVLVLWILNLLYLWRASFANLVPTHTITTPHS
jgi:hypothetical protein